MATAAWSAASARTSWIAAQAITTGANYLGSEIDNETNKDRYASVEILANFSSAPTAELVVMVYILYALDGTNYEDGDATPTDPKKGPVAVLPVRNATGNQRIAVRGIPLSPHKFKVLARNETDQTATTTVLVETYDETIA